MFQTNTQVRIDLKGLKETIKELKGDYDKIGNRDSYDGRSKFNAWNNISHFYQRIDNGEDSVVIPVIGSAKGSSARVYYKPSVTSLAKPIRKHIIPVVPGNQFMYFDLKAAEFFLNCLMCKATKAVEAYKNGEDIYSIYKSIFPEGTDRKIYKEILIAFMYDVTPYTISKKVGCSESYAGRMLEKVINSLVEIQNEKLTRILYAKANKGYFAPRLQDSQTTLVKVADFNPKTGFVPELALSCYVQSALGFWMQSRIEKISPRIKGTLLTVFDSMLLEHNPENAEKLRDYLINFIKPFRADSFSIGKTFYEAQYEGKSI